MRGSVKVFDVRLDYTGTPVDTTTIVQLSPSIPYHAKKLEIFDSSGQTMELFYGPVGSEVSACKILPGGNGQVQLILNQGMRIGVKAVSGTANVGELTINAYY